MPVHIERMQSSLSSQSLRGHSLDDIALNNVLLELGNETFVSGLSNIALGLVTKSDRPLVRHGGFRVHELTSDILNSG